MSNLFPAVALKHTSRKSYERALHLFDAAACEAHSVGQAQAARMAAPHIGYATYVFARMCSSAGSIMRIAPGTRWARSDFEDWHFGAIAPFARAILEGSLLFNYFIDPPSGEPEMKARVQILYMNDCMRRLELHRNIGASAEQIGFFEAEAADLRAQLGSNEYFATLPAPVQKQCMNGKFLMTASRDEMLARLGYDKGAFDATWDLWSQHVHILPLSFFRMEPNGRGTGVENQADRDYWTHALLMSAAALCSATNELVNIFPDVADSRLGVRSEFSPSPHANRLRPNRKKEGLAARAPVDSGQAILSAVEKLLELLDGET